MSEGVISWRPIFDAPGPVQEYARACKEDGWGCVGRRDASGIAVIVVAFAPSGYWHDALWCEVAVPPLPSASDASMDALRAEMAEAATKTTWPHGTGDVIPVPTKR